MSRIDTHHHCLPPLYRAALQRAGITDAGGRELPQWSAEASLETMIALDIDTAILSVSTPGTTFLPEPADATALARDINDYSAALVAEHPARFGFFATVPLPHVDAAVDEAIRALDVLGADGVVLLANSSGTYLGGRDRTTCSPHSTLARLWCSSTLLICPDAGSTGFPRLPRIFYSTPPAPHTCWYATESNAAIRTSNSCSAMAADLCPTRPTGWRYPC